MRSEPSAGVTTGWLQQHWLNLSVRAKGMIAVALPLLALFAIGTASLVLQYNERQQRQEGHAADVLNAAATQVLVDALNAETGVRGYVVTRDAAFLQPYYVVIGVIGKDLAAVRAAAAAERAGGAARAVTATTLKEMAELAQMRSAASGSASAITLRRELLSGKRTMDTLRVEVAGIANGQAAILQARRASIDRMETAIEVVTIAGLAVGLLAGIIGIALFASGISRRVAAAASNASRLGEGLPLDPSPAARDELGKLACSLGRAQRVLNDRTAELVTSRDEAVRATMAKNAFLSNTSHELRTPLNALLGFAQLLQLSDLSGEDRDGVERILFAGRHLLALINELIDVARIESGEFSLSPEPVAVLPLVVEACQLMAPLAADRSITINQHCPWPGLAVHADRQRLSQILVNLASNAIKYNRQGGSVTITCQAESPTKARMVVADTGPGMSAADLERIFVPFERLGAERTGIEGTGMGLPLARAFADAMGGTISASSVQGEGSAFTVMLPRAADMIPVKERPHQDPAALVGTADPTGALTRVLHVEDNPANVEVIARFLRSRPRILLHSVTSGKAALEYAMREVPDLILLDMHLPDLGGVEVLKMLRAEPASAGIPVAIVSAEAAPSVIRHMRASGVIAYLVKPLDLAQFGRLLDSFVAGELGTVDAASETTISAL
jgi:signal transduction histidine kinase/ActR/RegA family two-component response regulator